MVRELLNGLMVVNILVLGKMGNSMVRDFILIEMVNKEKGFGKTGKEKNGSINHLMHLQEIKIFRSESNVDEKI